MAEVYHELIGTLNCVTRSGPSEMVGTLLICEGESSLMFRCTMIDDREITPYADMDEYAEAGGHDDSAALYDAFAVERGYEDAADMATKTGQSVPTAFVMNQGYPSVAVFLAAQKYAKVSDVLADCGVTFG